jgi:hypothetical protein
MNKIIGLLAVLMFVTPAVADDLGMSGDYAGVRIGTGKVMEPGRTSPATNDTFDFGFQSNYVRICVRPENAQVAFFRMGHTLTTSTMAATNDNTGATLYVPDGNFIDSNSYLPGNALPMYTTTTASPDQVSNRCVNMNWVTRGITMFISSGVATADVWAFPRAENPRR